MSMGVIAVGAAVVGSAVSIYGAEKNRQAADDMATEAKIERDAQNALLDKEKANTKLWSLEIHLNVWKINMLI